MKIYTLSRTQFIARPLDEVFDFFSRPENLARITPPSMGFAIMTPGPIEMRAGTLIDYRVRTLGVPVRWTTLITDYSPPHRFVDVQLRGAYSFWHHTHTFEGVDGGTEIVDEVRYALPFGAVGRLVHALLVRRQLDMIFAFRKRTIDGILEDGGRGAFGPVRPAGPVC